MQNDNSGEELICLGHYGNASCYTNGPTRNTEDEQRLLLREAARLRIRSRQYRKGLANHENFDPTTVPGGRHNFTRYTNNRQETERTCQHCDAWKFPRETPGCCCRNGLVSVPAPQRAPAHLLPLFSNPRFMNSIRAYNNVFAFTSMDSVYNFRVQGSVCHRLGSLIPPSNRRAMYAQVYINDPDMDARVVSRMGMTDGLDQNIIETTDQVMTTSNEYTQGFLNARNLLIARAGQNYQDALTEYERRLESGEATPQDNPALHLSEFLRNDDDLRLRLHVTRNALPWNSQHPTASEVAAIVIDRSAAEHRDHTEHQKE
ncbi:Helitron helicase-like protein [Phytophthora palmivora]|uniref:Helitron helicase-like protein n=1 Tax=Phytophthora palmivora TaxID=4796 RepID=A0A2P4XYI9_9STRA|nr:Helitron helicase-like protein [Phytophthora palmivora]